MRFNVDFKTSGAIKNPDKLNDLIDDEWIEFLFQTKRASIKHIKRNLRKITFKRSTGRLAASNKADVKVGLGLNSELVVKNTARNQNTTAGNRVRYARFVEYGRPAVQGSPLLRFEDNRTGAPVVKRSVKLARPKPFFVSGVRKAINEELDKMAKRIEEKFGRNL